MWTTGLSNVVISLCPCVDTMFIVILLRCKKSYVPFTITLCVQKKFSFAEDDLEENILFDEREEGKFKSSNEALIKACTIHKLIERLTFHEYGGGQSTGFSLSLVHVHVFCHTHTQILSP